jgi:hypothetical protein
MSKPARKSGPPNKRGRKRRAGRRKPAPANELAILDALLMRKTRIRLNGEDQEVTAFEAILLQLLQKEAAGDTRASRVLLKYQGLARQMSEAPPQIAFVDSDYTQALASPVSEAGHG